MVSSQNTITTDNKGNSQISDEEPENEDQTWQPTSRSAIPSSTPKIPGYLLPPSYPSDPQRDPNVPLALSGTFTNSHFRTLHIIHAKSLRPRFHAPDYDDCRPGLRRLLGAKYGLDESDTGLGTFEWSVGQREVRVMERFCREVEFSNGQTHGDWGWSEEGLMHFLFRIVVGEVVRSEEH